MNKKLVRILIVILVVGVAGFMAFKFFTKKSQPMTLQTDVVKRGDISNTVTATGKLEASVTVEVGTQVSGRINKLFVDYNSKVKKGDLLMQLDTETLESTLESSRASLISSQAEYEYRKANYERYKQLVDKQLIAQKDFEEVEYSFRSSEANLASAKARYNKDKTNLEYAYIYSPIDGIVLEKSVEEGETVAASFSTPTLFTIVNDLTQMKIEASVDEADIGQLKDGQRVEFTVDAFPDKNFDGEVVEIHLMPAAASNVVTYVVVINASNPEKILMPGMTANVSFFVTERKNVLMVPNRAFEFRPTPDIFESLAKPENGGLTFEQPQRPKGQMPGGPGGQGQMGSGQGMPGQGGPGKRDESMKIVWVKNQNKVSPKMVKVGETDEINYEVLSGVEEGDEIIVSVSMPQMEMPTQSPMGRSPFMPTRPGRR